MAVFHSFHEDGEFERSLNATFLVLIPKKYDVEEVKVGTLFNLTLWRCSMLS